MYFYEILHSCEEKRLTEEFLKLCTGSPDLQKTRTAFEQFLKTIKAIPPELSETWTLFMTLEQDMKGNDYFHVFAREPNSPENFGIEITPWKEVLGWKIDSKIPASFEKELFTANVLWELTFLGFDEETIQNRVKSWDEPEQDANDLEGDDFS